VFPFWASCCNVSPRRTTQSGVTQISLTDFTRDMKAINEVYIPTAHKSGYYLRIATHLCVLQAGGRGCARRRHPVAAVCDWV